MNEELTIKAIALFDTAEKWNSFLELCNIAVGSIGHQNTQIQGKWWQKLQSEVFNREQKEKNSEWDIIIWNKWDIGWYLKEYGDKSLYVHFYGDAFRVFSYGALDLNKVNDLLKDTRFDAITDAFERIDGTNQETIGWEHRNFSFGTVFDGNFPNHQTLSWYAGNKTKEFADQIITKVRKFQTLEITELFKEINKKCRK